MEAHGRNRDGWMDRLEGEYEFLMRRAEYGVAAGRCEQARNDYQAAASLAPHNAAPLVGLGVVALHTHHLKEAQAAFEAACRLEAGCAKGLCGLAIVHHRNGRSEDAVRTYCQCLEQDGDNVTALLGLLDLSGEKKRWGEIRYFLQQYLLRHSDDVAVMLCLGAVYLNQEEFAAASDILFDILILDPRNATAAALVEELDHMKVNRELEQARQMYLMPAR
ncbi:MAG: tetratricopeptide repeat protein [Phycisphaerae bacterium]|nr:tetratricopeptide repeat protein [Phycisphaerae bacterium]